ncbi:MAG: acetyltransferase [Bacteroidia bacterium]|nr:acetyltransferase [Bacteroidia bacterium]
MAFDVIIIGAGGLGRESLMTFRESNRFVKNAEEILHFRGFVANSGEKNVCDEPILGDDTWALGNLPSSMRFAVAIGNPAQRRKVAEKYIKAGFEPFHLIHPSVITSEYVHFGRGIIVLPGVVFTTDIHIGDFCLINPRVSISHDVQMGNYVSIGPGATICGGVVIEDDVEIGAGATVLPGLTLGKAAFLGAGAVATRNLDPGKTYIGIPARPLLAKLSGTP